MISLREFEAEFKPRMHKALSFDGIDDYVLVPNTPSINPVKAITVIAWLKSNKPQTGRGVVTKGPLTNDYDYMLYFTAEGKQVSFYVKDRAGRSDSVTMNFIWVDNRWHSYAGVYDGSNLYLYIDGKLYVSKRTDLTNIRDSSNHLHIGAGWSGYFYSSISEVMIYKRALTEAEIKYLHNNPFAPLDLDNLVLWLTPASIDTVNGKWWDLSKYGNHGTIYGATEVNLVKSEVAVL